jgi:hypothetical protein
LRKRNAPKSPYRQLLTPRTRWWKPKNWRRWQPGGRRGHEINTRSASPHRRLHGADHRPVGQQFQSGQIKKSELERYLDDARESTALILSNTERAANLIQSFKQVAVDQTSERAASSTSRTTSAKSSPACVPSCATARW